LDLPDEPEFQESGIPCRRGGRTRCRLVAFDAVLKARVDASPPVSSRYFSSTE
jgi:hypothetical protein